MLQSIKLRKYCNSQEVNSTSSSVNEVAAFVFDDESVGAHARARPTDRRSRIYFRSTRGPPRSAHVFLGNDRIATNFVDSHATRSRASIIGIVLWPRVTKGDETVRKARAVVRFNGRESRVIRLCNIFRVKMAQRDGCIAVSDVAFRRRN